MIIQIDGSSEINTDRDFNSEERHILQKLFCYRDFVGSVAEFRQKKNQALNVGWGDSGPVRESEAMALVSRHLEKQLVLRLQNKTNQ